MELKGSKTEKNLMEAFAGESQARNKYTYFASKAKKEGYEQIASIFQETADNEKEHAKLWFKLLHDGEVPTTVENLKAAAAGENHEHKIMYPEFAAQAKEDGMHEAATVMTEIGEVEEEHEKRYLKLAENIEKNTVFRRDQSVKWRCRNCGYVHVGNEAPKICPACAHSQAHYEILCENY